MTELIHREPTRVELLRSADLHRVIGAGGVGEGVTGTRGRVPDAIESLDLDCCGRA